MKMIAPGWKLQELKTQSEAQSGVLMMDHTSKQVLEAWGVCGACPEDIDGDGEVGFRDLLILLFSWS